MNLNLDDLIKRIKVNSRLKFKNDNHYYYSKNISVDQKNIFVTLNGLQTYRKALKNLIQVDNYYLNQLNEESYKNLLIKKILDSSLSKEQKNKYLKQYEDSGYDYKMIKQILLKMDKNLREGIHNKKEGGKIYQIKVEGGDKRWYLNGKLHREKGPAVEGANGYKAWYLNGKLHREDGPAIEYADGSKSWYLNGILHREDGPAIEDTNGYKVWYLNGKFHREDGPAIEYANGSKFWYLNGKPHREDGPAVEDADGSKAWYLNGKELTEKEWKSKVKLKPKSPPTDSPKSPPTDSPKSKSPTSHTGSPNLNFKYDLKEIIKKVLKENKESDPTNWIAAAIIMFDKKIEQPKALAMFIEDELDEAGYQIVKKTIKTGEYPHMKSDT